ncbi:TPA: hypothetical protein RQN76_004164 [Aeromonas dhakensis]|nr:hypothetical protein [Aeromonas dhakensis]
MLLYLLLIALVFYVFIDFRSRKRNLTFSKFMVNGASDIIARDTFDNVGESADEIKSNPILIEKLTYLSLVMFGNSYWKKNVLQLSALCFFASLYLQSKYQFWGRATSLIYFLACILFIVILIALLYKKKKELKYRDDFYNFLDLFISSISAGKSVPSSFEQSHILKDNIIVPYAKSISLLLKKGIGIDNCIEQSLVKKKFPYTELELFTVLLSVNMSRGAQLTSPLVQLRSDMALQDRLRAKLATLTAEARMSRNILSGLPIAFLLLTYFTNYSSIEWLLYTTPGRILFVVCSIMILIGIFICSKLVSGALK